jgi:hypothetical protein
MCIQLNGKIQQLRSPYNSFRKTGPTTQQLAQLMPRLPPLIEYQHSKCWARPCPLSSTGPPAILYPTLSAAQPRHLVSTAGCIATIASSPASPPSPLLCPTNIENPNPPQQPRTLTLTLPSPRPPPRQASPSPSVAPPTTRPSMRERNRGIPCWSRWIHAAAAAILRSDTTPFSGCGCGSVCERSAGVVCAVGKEPLLPYYIPLLKIENDMAHIY